MLFESKADIVSWCTCALDTISFWFACRETRMKQKRIPNTLNKPCRVESVTSWNRDSKPCQSIIFLFVFLIYIENSPMDFSRESQTWTNTSEFENRLVEVRNCTKSESLSKVQGRESLIFQIYVTFSIDFPNIYNDYLLVNATDSFLLLFW